MDRRLAAATLIGAAAACGGVSPGGGGAISAEEEAAAAASRGDTAAMHAARLAGSLGGREAWDRTRYVSFRWIVEREGQVVANREHSWDRYDGRYRVADERAGARHVTIFNLNELAPHPELDRVPAGRAWVDGAGLEGAARDSALRRGYTAFVNDAYWALMPYKWNDPGVRLSYDGRRELADGREYAAIRLSFDEGLGVTEDQYWGFLDDSGRMAAWQYHLQGREEPNYVIWWTDWTRVGDIEFAMTRADDDGQRFIYFEDVAAGPTVPEGRFDPPSP